MVHLHQMLLVEPIHCRSCETLRHNCDSMQNPHAERFLQAILWSVCELQHEQLQRPRCSAPVGLIYLVEFKQMIFSKMYLEI